MEWLQDFANTPNHPLGLLVLFLAAGIEYVFPPFPGDTVTLGGAVLVGRWNWSFCLVFGAVILGSTVGAAIDYLVGMKLHKWREGKDTKADQAVRRILKGFKRYGIWLIAANRFFPGIRAFFFVAAGMAGFSLLPVVALALISAVLWNLLLVGIGMAVGANFDRIVDVVCTYQTCAWVAIGIAAVAGLLFYLLRRRPDRSAES